MVTTRFVIQTKSPINPDKLSDINQKVGEKLQTTSSLRRMFNQYPIALLEEMFDKLPPILKRDENKLWLYYEANLRRSKDKILVKSIIKAKDVDLIYDNISKRESSTLVERLGPFGSLPGLTGVFRFIANIPSTITSIRQERIESFPPNGIANLEQYFYKDYPTGIGLNNLHQTLKRKPISKNVQLADIQPYIQESHIEINHIDFKTKGNPSNEKRDMKHSLATIGTLVSIHNGTGTKGILKEFKSYWRISPRKKHNKSWSASEEILQASIDLSKGDVMLIPLEVKDNILINNRFRAVSLPIIYSQPEKAAINYALASGIHVVIPAGNNPDGMKIDLDNLEELRYHDNVPKPIIVGSSTIKKDPDMNDQFIFHEGSFSKTIDIFAPSDFSFVPFPRSLSNPSFFKRKHIFYSSKLFGGTSLAATIVAGSVALISNQTNPKNTSTETMRKMLIKTGKTVKNVDGLTGKFIDPQKLYDTLKNSPVTPLPSTTPATTRG